MAQNNFIFETKDILNSRIRHISGSIPFYTSTETGMFNKRKVTVLHNAQGGPPLGVIDWGHDEIEVHGQRKKLGDLAYKPGWLMRYVGPILNTPRTDLMNYLAKLANGNGRTIDPGIPLNGTLVDGSYVFLTSRLSCP